MSHSKFDKVYKAVQDMCRQRCPVYVMAQVKEETGFDVGSRLKNNDYIEIHMQEKRSRLYIIQGVC